MIDQKAKEQCNGCKMCKDLCPKNAISYNVDREGFWYPIVDYNKCISCGLCVKRCPNINQIKYQTEKPLVYAAWSKSSDIRLASTSGGIFYELAKNVIEAGGYVAGCVYTEDFKGAKHILVHSMEELPPLMVSKYLQSDTEDIYKQVKQLLELNQQVLFVGAPCHCAAMASYLNKNYENLILCDFICRGANSPKAHQKYVEFLEKKYGADMTSLRSKDKRNGWNHFGQSATFSNGKEYFGDRQTDLRIVAYHYGNLMMRQACNQCQFKHIPRDGADITLADFWGISSNEVHDVEKGISLVMLNSKKGQEIFDKIDSRIEKVEKTLEEAERGNSAIHTSAPKGKNRDAFLQDLDKIPFDRLVAKYRDKQEKRILKRLKRAKRKIKSIFA